MYKKATVCFTASITLNIRSTWKYSTLAQLTYTKPWTVALKRPSTISLQISIHATQMVHTRNLLLHIHTHYKWMYKPIYRPQPPYPIDVDMLSWTSHGATLFLLLPTKDYEVSLASLIFLPPSAAVASDGTPQPDQKQAQDLKLYRWQKIRSENNNNNNNNCNKYHLFVFSEDSLRCQQWLVCVAQMSNAVSDHECSVTKFICVSYTMLCQSAGS